MGDTDIFIVGNGVGGGVDTGEFVEALNNVPGAPDATPIARVSPDRGLKVILENHVEKGEQSLGIPVFARLYDTNGNRISPGSSLYWRITIQGQREGTKMSREKGNISFYYSNDITTQRDEENVDGAKFVLTTPETMDEVKPVDQWEVRDIDDLDLMLDAASTIDWERSELYVMSDAVRQEDR